MTPARRCAVLLSVLLTASCAGSGRDEALSRAPSFRAKSAAIAATRNARGKGLDVARALARRLEASGLKATALEESDSVLAGSAIGVESAINPRLLDEIRGATGAEAIVFLTLDPSWKSLEVVAVDSRSGDAVLRAPASPRGDAFASADEIAAAAARILAPISAVRRTPRASRPDEPVDELPLP